MKQMVLRILRRGAALLLISAFLTASALGAGGVFHRTRTPQGLALEPSEGLYCALRAPFLQAGSLLYVLDEQGVTVHTVLLAEDHTALLGPLAPASNSQLLLPDGSGGAFCLAENAAVTALSGAVHADGEVLYCARTVDLLCALYAAQPVRRHQGVP